MHIAIMAHRFKLLEVIVDVVICLDERPTVIEDRTNNHSKAVHVAEDAADLLLLHFGSYANGIFIVA